MALSVWEYIRQRTADAVLAGCRDALDILERQDQAAVMWSAAKALRQQLNEASRASGPPTGAQPNNPSSQIPASPAQQRPPLPATLPTASAPAASRTPSVPANSATVQNPERRKAGRPRKEVFG